jgi:hypothetical protein
MFHAFLKAKYLVLYAPLHTVCSQSPFGDLKNCGAQKIELATCGLQQVIVKLWKFLNFFFFCHQQIGISGHLYVSQSVVCETATMQEHAHWGLQVRAFLDRTFPGRWKAAHIEVY